MSGLDWFVAVVVGVSVLGLAAEGGYMFGRWVSALDVKRAKDALKRSELARHVLAAEVVRTAAADYELSEANKKLAAENQRLHETLELERLFTKPAASS